MEGWLRRDEHGFLVTGPDLLRDGEQPAWPLARAPLFLESSQRGLLVAGDVRHGSIKRVASAVGDDEPPDPRPGGSGASRTRTGDLDRCGGNDAKTRLDSMKGWLVAHNAAVMTVLFLVFGVNLIATALPPLTA